jgi:hypothetical protein
MAWSDQSVGRLLTDESGRKRQQARISHRAGEALKQEREARPQSVYGSRLTSGMALEGVPGIGYTRTKSERCRKRNVNVTAQIATRRVS